AAGSRGRRSSSGWTRSPRRCDRPAARGLTPGRRASHVEGPTRCVPNRLKRPAPMRRPPLDLSALVIPAPAAAPQAANPDPDDVVASGGAFPEGWTARVDRDQPIDRVSFRSMGEGFHATMGPAAVFYNPQMSKSGDYKVAARFRQTRAPAHPEA